MSTELQTILALSLVGLALAFLARRLLLRRRNRGCQEECDCAAKRRLR